MGYLWDIRRIRDGKSRKIGRVLAPTDKSAEKKARKKYLGGSRLFAVRSSK